MDASDKASFSQWAGDRKIKWLVLAILFLGAVALGAYTYLTMKEARYVYSGPTTISVRGTGEVNRVPDIATFSFAVQAQTETVAEAQERSAQATNAITAYLKEQGVAETDIKTLSYNLSPRYEWIQQSCMPGQPCPGGRSELIGYEVSQFVEVKVRDTDQAGELIAGVGERGATNVSSLRFTLDDEDAAKKAAREMAITEAQEKAEVLAESLGVRIVRLTGFWEEEGGYYPMYDRGMGGTMMESTSVAPNIPAGENSISTTVNLTYEIR